MISKLEIKKYPAIISSETSKNGAFGLKTTIALHYAARAMGGVTLRQKKEKN